MTEDILWKGKTELKPNVWGIRNEGGRLYFDFISKRHGYDRHSLLAIILFSLIIIPLTVVVFEMVLLGLGVLIGVLSICFMFYWLVIREVIFYRLIKTMRYEITKSEIRIIAKPFIKVKTITIPIVQIDTIHLVKYDMEAQTTGTILIFLNKKVKGYNLSKKESWVQPQIEQIIEFEKVVELLIRLMKDRNQTKEKEI